MYRLPLPPGAEVNGFAVWDEGEKLVGEILPRSQATRIYGEERTRLQEKVQAEERTMIRQRLRDPGELTRDASRQCSIRVFPILRFGMKRIEVDYSIVLEPVGGRFAYSFPLGLARAFRHVGETTIEVDLGDGLGLAGLEVPAGTRREGENPVRLTWTRHGVPEGDFELAWRHDVSDIGVHLVSHRPEGDDGFFLLRVSPKVETLEAASEPTDWLVLADLSGSVVREKEALLGRLVSEVLHALPRGDRFRLVAFGERTRLLSGGWATADPENVRLALEELEAVAPEGSPTLEPILEDALAELPDDRPGRVLLVTDGIFPDDDPEDLAEALERELPARSRLDVLGFGYDDDQELLARLAGAGRGEVRAPSLVMAGGMSTADLGLRAPGNRDAYRPYGRFTLPAGPVLDRPFLLADRAPLRGLAFAVSGGAIELLDVHADWGDGLFPGEAAFVFGRYRASGPAVGRLEGRLGSAQWSRELRIDFPAVEPDNRMVAAFWARREVEAMERAAGGNFSESDKARIVRLSMEYRFVTSQTAFLALTDEMRERHDLGEAPPDDIEEFYTFSEGVPEPETVVLVLLAILVLFWAARRRAQAKAFA